MESKNNITYFGETDFRNKKTPFGIKASDRTRHMYVIGKTGMGKSTLLENLAVQDIQSGNGIAFMDPHGGTADKLLDYVPENRIEEVIYFAPFDTDFPVSFNVMEDVDPDKRFLVVNGLMSAFKKIWVDAWSARMEYILNNILLALLEYPDSTLLGVNRMLADKEYRKKVVNNVTDPTVKQFWVDEYGKWDEKFAREAGAAIQNKIGQFVSNPIIRNIIGQTKSTFSMRDIMDKKKIFIVNLSKGQVGEDSAKLLGSMLITKIYLAAMSRADVSQEELKKLPNFYLFVDEFQSFANESFADILSEARKYKLNLTMAHQYIEQMPDEVRSAVFGNVGTMIIFRVGSFDAEIFEKEFAPTFVADDIVNLGFAQIYLRLMIDGMGSSPFSATTLPPIKEPTVSYKSEIIESSRKNFARPRAEVEQGIQDWHALNVPEKKEAVTERKSFDGGREQKPRTTQRFPQEQRTFQTQTQKRDFVKPPFKERQNEPIKRREFDNKQRFEKAEASPETPALGGLSLKDALATALSEKEKSKEINLHQDKKIFDKQKVINNEIETENKNKLRNALAGVLEEQKKKEEAEKEKNEPKKEAPKINHFDQIKSEKREVPEDVLRRVLE